MTELIESPQRDQPPASTPARREPRPRRDLERWSLPVVFVLTIVVFSVARPDAFPTVSTASAILHQNMPTLLVLAGLCMVLAMREFDLSFPFVAGASGALAVQAMAAWDLGTPTAVALGVGLGLLLGLVNGLLVAYVGVSSFIGTLATGSVVQGLMMAIAGETVFEGITDGYREITSTRVGPIYLDVLLGLAVVVVLGMLLRLSVLGRHATAIGDSPEAARIAGIPVARTKLTAFAIVGLCAGLAGVVITSQAGQYYPNPASGLLLPVYAAAFLSLSIGRGWRFNVAGATLGSIFLAAVATGVTMLNQPSWLAQLLQGAILLVAIVALSRRQATR